VRAIPEGFVLTYGDVDPVAPRLVGHALAHAPDDVPWHRVVRADGSVAMGSPHLELLRKEGVPLRGDRVDLRYARWPEAEDSWGLGGVRRSRKKGTCYAGEGTT
jgi:alkylated DNA nucleotide flippase Atl1